MEQNSKPEIECHGLDTPDRVCFYEQDFYVLSNFSSFTVRLADVVYPTAEHAYHVQKFTGCAHVAIAILTAPSAHVAFQIAQRHKPLQHVDWNEMRLNVMRNILRAKVAQHEYVRRKLLATGDRQLVENSWRDDYWGWGPAQDGQNMLGKLWMEIREELKTKTSRW